MFLNEGGKCNIFEHLPTATFFFLYLLWHLEWLKNVNNSNVYRSAVW